MITKDSNYTLIPNKKKISEEFREIFKEILGKPVDTTEERITYLTAEPEDKIFSQKGLKISIIMLKNNKTTGEDSIN